MRVSSPIRTTLSYMIKFSFAQMTITKSKQANEENNIKMFSEKEEKCFLAHTVFEVRCEVFLS